MKLVAAVGARPASATPSRSATKTKGKTVGSVTARVPAPTSPAAEATRGRELLDEARRVLAGLATCARPG